MALVTVARPGQADETLTWVARFDAEEDDVDDVEEEVIAGTGSMILRSSTISTIGMTTSMTTSSTRTNSTIATTTTRPLVEDGG